MLKYFTVLLILFESTALKQLCSVSKRDNVCVCKRTTDADGNLVTIADCARIELQEFPDPAQLTSDVNILDLSHNKIEKLESSYNYPNLNGLILSYNYINSISDGFFNGFPNLRKLVLNNNNLTNLNSGDLFRNLQQLQHLDLSFNNIQTLQNYIFTPLNVLSLLDLSYNDLSLGDWLTHSPDTLSANLGVTTNISHLLMNNLGLKKLQHQYFSNYTNLKYLCLADNYFESLPSVPYSVEHLDFSGSDITVLQAKDLNYHSLKTLKLNRMRKLRNLHQYAFYNVPILEELSMTDCRQLREFNELSFGLLSRNTALPLRKLSLARNSLQTLNSTFIYLFSTLEHLDLRDNPWKCDCDLLWLHGLGNFYKNESIRCASPAYLSGKKVFDIVEKDVPSCYPEKYGKKSHRILLPILIVLVMILSALIGYLIYYGPSWYGPRSRPLGPNSPYNVARTEED